MTHTATYRSPWYYRLRDRVVAALAASEPVELVAHRERLEREVVEAWGAAAGVAMNTTPQPHLHTDRREAALSRLRAGVAMATVARDAGVSVGTVWRWAQRAGGV